MQDRHSNKRQYFNEQGITTKKYVIPYVEPFIAINERTRVLEIGCGEAGNLVPFIERGCECMGVDLNGENSSTGNDYSYLWTTNDGNIVAGGNTLTPLVFEH